SNYSTGNDISPENKTNDRIVINGSVIDGKLKFIIFSQTVEYGQEFITELTQEFEKCVEQLIDYCESYNEEEMTLSDFDSDNITVEALEEINSFLDLI
ncbi:hypothetical protein, partial [Ruminococcus flavefaciens]|uniref:hypothetical protein n=1 Tax=Ruminococcus flavefaciens TaxID=1265 RepID=UPI000560E762